MHAHIPAIRTFSDVRVGLISEMSVAFAETGAFALAISLAVSAATCSCGLVLLGLISKVNVGGLINKT